MQNLRDKLLKAGLVSEEQAKQAEVAKPPRREAPPPERGPREDAPRRDERRGDARRDERPRGGGGGRGFGGGAGGGRGGFGGGGGGGRPAQGRIPAFGGAGGGRGAPAGPAVPKLPPLPGSKEAQRQDAKKQQQTDRALRELVAAGQVPVDVGATVFYFLTRKNKLRRLELTEPQAQALADGKLAVVERPEPSHIEHSLVPPEVAEKVLALSERAVRFWNRPGAAIGFMSDDALKGHQDREAEGGDEAGAEAAEVAGEHTADDSPAADAEETAGDVPDGDAAEAKATDAGE